MKLIKKIIFTCLTTLLFLNTGCQFLKADQKTASSNDNGYYSIKGFLNDQWNLLHDQPIVLLRVADFNNHKDSTHVHLDSTLWKNIRKQFDPTDISDSRYLNQYQFSNFTEDKISTIFLNYKALNKDLLTKNLTIGIDNYNHKIKSIFIETAKGNKTYERTQKLTYVPNKLIRIQSFEKSIASSPENITISYYFEY